MSEHYADPAMQSSTLVELLRLRALNRPDQPLYTFLLDGEAAEAVLTCAELDRQARSIGAQLQEHMRLGERALLLYPPGLDFIAAFFGCLYAGVVAVPVYPPRINRPDIRLETICTDAQASIALTTSQFLADMERRFMHMPQLQSLQWITPTELATDRSAAWRDPGVRGNDLAFLQYTSGSTSLPKGVMLSHGNLLHNLSLIHECFGTTPETRGVSWLPLYHDMGLIGGVLEPLYCGGTTTLMSPLTFLQRPFRWLQAIARTRATVSGGPNFAYDFCVRRTTPEQRATLDLSCWEVAFNGAEPVRASTLEAFVAAFGPCRFRRQAFFPCYGLAEATLFVSGGGRAAWPVLRTFDGEALEHKRVVEISTEEKGGRCLVGCGKIQADEKVMIVDPDTGLPCLPDQVGEIWAASPSVAHGYWQRPEETAHTFQARLAGTGEGPFLRTGDLGFFNEGELFIAGRLKDLIIINGGNHYPQDIELTVEGSHPCIQTGGSAAFSVDAAGEERLVIVAEVERSCWQAMRRSAVGPGPKTAGGAEEVIRAIQRAVVEQHDVPVYNVTFLKPGHLPRTSSGKVQRHACRNRFLEGTLEAMDA
jgi:acyl-CoA synthetase (AMP-forming)/AMP-acid ligase II